MELQEFVQQNVVGRAAFVEKMDHSTEYLGTILAVNETESDIFFEFDSGRRIRYAGIGLITGESQRGADGREYVVELYRSLRVDGLPTIYAR
jgi:hypothetical protein